MFTSPPFFFFLEENWWTFSLHLRTSLHLIENYEFSQKEKKKKLKIMFMQAHN